MRAKSTHQFKLGFVGAMVAVMAMLSQPTIADDNKHKNNVRVEYQKMRNEVRKEYYKARAEYREAVADYRKAVYKNRADIVASSADFPFDLKYKGVIELSGDNKMITGISANGFVEINKTAFGNNRRLFIHADDKGTITYEYYVGKTETAFNPEGKKWLGEVLPDIVKRSDLGVESRVRQLYKTKGLSAVLSAMEDLPSSSTYTYSSEWNVFTIKTSSYKSGSSASKNTFFKDLGF